jgi:tRNA threonylcarbamoyladenosine biosynthesis protein TsaB
VKVLAFDTALAACSAAVWSDGAILAARLERLDRGHAEALMPMVEAVRTEAGLAYQDIDRLAVTIGPGTFTGLRIGLAAARGLALAIGRPLVGVTTLEALAAGVSEDERQGQAVLAVIDARRSEVYAQAFDAGLAPLAPPSLSTVTGAARLAPAPLITVGSGALLVQTALVADGKEARVSEASETPDAAVVAALAAGRAVVSDEMPSPLYLRAPDARLPGTAARDR